MVNPPLQNRSKYATTAQRNKRVLELLSSRLRDWLEEPDRQCAELDPEAMSIFNALVAPLTSPHPQASQEAEASIVLAHFSLAEDRVLDIDHIDSTDLNDKGRIDGDRTTGDKFCSEVLAANFIPCTQGPFQSSSYRSGYSARQTRTQSLADYAKWQSDPERKLEEIDALADRLASVFASNASRLPNLPKIVAARFSFSRFVLARQLLTAQPSGGAYEQYLLAGLLQQEAIQINDGSRVVTKHVTANDRSASAGGDIEIRHGQRLLRAIEVSASDWRRKLGQISPTALHATSEITIAAHGVHHIDPAELVEAVEPLESLHAMEISVVELTSLMDVTAAKIGRHGRAAAFESAYSNLVKWHRRQPYLVEHLITVLENVEVASAGENQSNAFSNPGLVDYIRNGLRIMLDGQNIASSQEVSNSLRTIAQELEGTG